eukprot:GSMAST32.ASY1.ANO1.2270.1 assembled CDS
MFLSSSLSHVSRIRVKHILFRQRRCIKTESSSSCKSIQLPTSILSHLRSIVKQALNSSSPGGVGVLRRVISLANGNTDADYQCNTALGLASLEKRRPQDIANELATNIRQCADPCISKVEVSGPGFINIYIDDPWNPEMSLKQKVVEPIDQNSKNILLDFASPNMSKELHVGHLRSSVIGDTLARILEFSGNKVTRVSHVGDWGTPIAMVVAFIHDLPEDRQPLFMKNQMTETETILPTPAELSSFYTASKEHISKYDDNRVGSIRHSWLQLCTASRKGFHDIFSRLDELGESVYAPLISEMIADLNTSGLKKKHRKMNNKDCKNSTEGRKDEEQPPMIIEKSDTTHLYATTDLAALRCIFYMNFNLIFFSYEISQKKHFSNLFHVAKLAGWLEASPNKFGLPSLEHVSFGLVKGKDDRKCISRDGNVPTLSSLLSEVHSVALDTVERSIQKDDMNECNSNQLVMESADALMQGALRYFELSHHRQSDYAADVTRMMESKGNTSVSLLYACARINSIFARSEHSGDVSNFFDTTTNDTKSVDHLNMRERQVALAISQFPEVIDAVVAELTPHLLCNYLFRLATLFHSFYSNERIINHSRQDFRLALCRDTLVTLQTGLHLLGVPPVNKL